MQTSREKSQWGNNRSNRANPLVHAKQKTNTQSEKSNTCQIVTYKMKGSNNVISS